MPTVWENSYVDRLHTLFEHKGQAHKIAEEVREAIEPLIRPDAAKILTAIATDLMTTAETRNRRADVIRACAALQTAIAMLEKVDPDLDG